MSKKPYVSNAELNRRLQQQKAHLLNNRLQQAQPLQYVTATIGTIENKAGVLVHNWRSGWKWLSNWAFILIGYISVYGVPNEVLMFVPEASQAKVTGLFSFNRSSFSIYQSN